MERYQDEEQRKGFLFLMNCEKGTHLHGYSKLARFQKPDMTSDAKNRPKDQEDFLPKEYIWSVHQLHPYVGYN
ncbi:hypothetical protein HNR31_003273 [Anoxybacillus caldiproteolyticus]|uniref:Uncharacterized protein n=1 Tax=Thermaerobacillus caldiproteolyticus TaxID=247480 RepID=A0A7V9Z9B6_9BACL|nr:hypothetical protein [Anoxybacillus caldiproteolyticus]